MLLQNELYTLMENAPNVNDIINIIGCDRHCTFFFVWFLRTMCRYNGQSVEPLDNAASVY